MTRDMYISDIKLCAAAIMNYNSSLQKDFSQLAKSTPHERNIHDLE